VELAEPAQRQLDAESADWLRRLSAGESALRQQAEAELHARLPQIALAEAARRSGSTPVTGPELTDVAHQAADDAMLAVLAKLADFRGEAASLPGPTGLSSWKCRASSGAITGATRRSGWTLRSGSGCPTGSGSTRSSTRSQRASSPRYAGALLKSSRRTSDGYFVAIVVDGIPLDALAAATGLRRNAVYKVVFDARRKIRRALVAKGHLDDPGLEQ
jgi:RNA polymerase sigma-70 factor (ECF subfamily)